MDTYGDVQQSFGRCLRENRDFVPTFYRRLLASDERIAAMFQHTDWTQQSKLIRRGISTAITYAGTPTAARRQIEEMAKVHGRGGHAPVPPSYYQHWIDSLIETVSESDPRFDPTLEKRWLAAITPAIEKMKAAY